MTDHKYEHFDIEEKEGKVPGWLKVVYVIMIVWAGIYLALYLRP